MPKYHLPNGEVYSSDTDLSPADLDYLASGRAGHPAPSASHEPSLIDKVGGWRGLAGTGIRVGSGLLSAEGGFLGAGISGLGEGLAELAEGSSLSPTKIGVEAGFGAVPFGKVVKGGKLAASALKSGALGAAHQAVSDVAGGQAPDIKRTAISGGLGALLGAGGAHLMTPGAPAPSFTPKVSYEAGTRVLEAPPGAVKNPIRPNLSPSFQSGYADTVRSKLGQLLGGEEGATAGLSDLDKNIATTKAASAKTRTASAAREATGQKAEAGLDLATTKADMKAAENEIAKRRIAEHISDQGLVPGATRVSMGESAVGPGGEKLSATTPFKKPKKSSSGEWTEEDLLDEGAGAISRPHDAPPGGTPSGDVYDSWIDHGRDHKTALKLTIKGLTPKLPVAGAEGAVPAVESAVTTPAAAAAVEAATPSAPEAITSTAPAVKPGRKSVGKVQKFNKSVQDILGMTGEPNVATGLENATPQAVAPAIDVAPQASAITPAAETTSSPLMQIFKSPVDAAGANYRAAKGATGENPLARQQAGISLQSEAKKAGLPTRGPGDLAKFLGEKVSPAIAEGEKAAAPPVEQAPAAAPVEESWKGTGQEPDWIQKELDAIERLKGQKGEISPRASQLLTRIGTGGIGALAGAPIGAYANPDDPYSALKGALAGGMLGFAGAGGAQSAMAAGKGAGGGAARELINYRNAGLLAGPSAQLKKPLSDIGAVIGHGLERSLTPGSGQQGREILKELFRIPTNVSNYADAMKNPQLAGEVIGDALRSTAPPETDLLGLVGRPFGAAQYSTQKMLERAGVPLDEARKILFLGDPETKLGKFWLSAQDPRVTGEIGSKFVKAVRPFTRIATNLAERGVQRIPGISLMTGDPETRLGRTLIGSAAAGAGALTGMSDVADEATGAEPTSPMVRGLRRAAMASYGLPFIAGEAAFGPRGARDLYYAIPGLNSLIQPPAPKDTLFSYGGKQLRNWLDQMLPSWANPVDAEKPLR